MLYSNVRLVFIPRSMCGICSRQRGTVMVLSVSTSDPPWHHSISAPHSHPFVYHWYCIIQILTSITSFDVLLTVHLSIFISVINQLDAQNFCFTLSLFHASTCFEHMCSSPGGQNCITQPLVSSHWNKWEV